MSTSNLNREAICITRALCFHKKVAEGEMDKTIKVLQVVFLLNIFFINLYANAQTDLAGPALLVKTTKDETNILNDKLLNSLFPELKNPRLMNLQDFSDRDERDFFIKFGYSFVLRGDFDRDGFDELAFVGKYDYDNDSKKNSFFAIVSLRGEKIKREFFSKVMMSTVSLIKERNYKPGTDAILLVYKFGSEECGAVFWAGTKYQYEPCQAVF